MLFQIIKKDILKRKGVNVILFLFITLSTIFLSSSVNNILIISSGVDYYMEYANVPDLNIVLNDMVEQEQIDEYLKDKKEAGVISSYGNNYFAEIADSSISIKGKEGYVVLENKGSGMFLSTLDSEYCKVFDEKGKTISLKKGEIGVPVNVMRREKLAIGDTMRIKSNGVEKTFRIKAGLKDAAFGSEMIGMSRFVVNEDDFSLFHNNTQLGVYYINVDDATFASDFSDQGFKGVMNTITRDMYRLAYSFDMILAGLLILIGICLILIALLVLRFTIVFTVDEQYQEIGILKAIGIKNFTIKKIYLVKYFFIVVIGALLGTFISIPISQFMIQSVNENMIMANEQLNLAIPILCALFIIAIVITFCYLCTRKLNKISAITAIRKGNDGDNYKAKRLFSLAKSNHLPTTLFLGLNDIASHLSRYAILVITICFSFILITIPLNTVNTMRSDAMAEKFSLDPDSSVYASKLEQNKEEKYRTVDDLKEGMKQLQNKLDAKGYKAKLTGNAIYFFGYQNLESHKKTSIMTLQMVGEEKQFFTYDEGSAPQLENEVAFSKQVMEENNWVIGDMVSMQLQDQEKTMYISGSYTDYMQIGKSAKLNSKIDCGQEIMFDYWNVMVDFKTKKSQSEVAAILQKQIPMYEWKSARDIVNQNIGGIQDTLNGILIPMTALLYGIIALIIVLMEKLFITQEKGEIAMMKSIGFTHRSITNWQIIRMAGVSVIAMIVSIPLSFVSNHFVLRPIFSFMGAEIAIQVDPLQAYLIYPGILILCIIVATIIATRSMKKITIREMNNLE